MSLRAISPSRIDCQPTHRMAACTSVVSACLLAGCTTPALFNPNDPHADQASRARTDFGPFTKVPTGRVGSLPCHGPLSFYADADPGRLGKHSYRGGSGEKRRGIVYTLHGGFIDIAHLRKTIDWTAYHQVRFEHALLNGWQGIVLPSKEGAIARVSFNYPAWWQAISETEREKVIHELSIRLAQRLTVTQCEWHEIATWFGYSSTFYPEKPSAFTYDDMTSHLLGAKIGGLGLRDHQQEFDASVTMHLKQELSRLGAVSPSETNKAIEMVRGKWWRNGFVSRPQLDISLDDGSVDPWIVPGFPDGRTMAGFRFERPSLRDVAGHDLSHFEQLEIEPRLSVWSAMRRLLPDAPDMCRPAEHFPILMRHIRQKENH